MNYKYYVKLNRNNVIIKKILLFNELNGLIFERLFKLLKYYFILIKGWNEEIIRIVLLLCRI